MLLVYWQCLPTLSIYHRDWSKYRLRDASLITPLDMVRTIVSPVQMIKCMIYLPTLFFYNKTYSIVPNLSLRFGMSFTTENVLKLHVLSHFCYPSRHCHIASVNISERPLAVSSASQRPVVLNFFLCLVFQFGYIYILTRCQGTRGSTLRPLDRLVTKETFVLQLQSEVARRIVPDIEPLVNPDTDGRLFTEHDSNWVNTVKRFIATDCSQ